ncbi:MAG: hypothetical protein AAF633_22845 [Chloroflexota bacterium]
MAFQQWEYKICIAETKSEFKGIFKGWASPVYLTIDDEDFHVVEGLEKLGLKGWELAGVQTVTSQLTGSTTMMGEHPISFYVFKRPI